MSTNLLENTVSSPDNERSTEFLALVEIECTSTVQIMEEYE
jgi:hypothetical protein